MKSRWAAWFVATSVALSFPLAGCKEGADGDGGPSAKAGDAELVVSAPTVNLKDHKLTISTGEFSTLISTVMVDATTSKKGASYRFYLSDGPISSGQPADGKTLVYVSIVGPDGSDTSKPLPTGKYTPRKDMMDKDIFMKVGELEIRAGGKTEDVRGFDGTVELVKSDATEVEGTIDLKKDGISVNGSFKAKKKP